MNNYCHHFFAVACFTAVLFLCAYGVLAGTVIRERSEATLGTSASNVSGNGNISLFAMVNGGYRTGVASVDPVLGGSIGVGGIMQFAAQTTISNFRSLGATEAHLQITVPGNDRLRFFGGAIAGDMYLSTFQDTLSVGADTAKPAYNPYLLASAVIDADWLALINWLPLKTYAGFGFVDDVASMDRYSQLAVKYAGEWKMKENSFFIDGGVGFYKEKRNRTNLTGDQKYEQISAWLQPGGRYRILDRFSVMAGVRFPVFSRVKSENGLRPLLVQASIKLEAPILFKETNTEAIRTLVFMEREKEKKKHVAVARTKVKTTEDTELPEDVENELFGLGVADTTSSGLFQDEVNVQKEREDVQKKMDDIEKILNETDKQ